MSMTEHSHLERLQPALAQRHTDLSKHVICQVVTLEQTTKVQNRDLATPVAQRRTRPSNRMWRKIFLRTATGVRTTEERHGRFSPR